MNSANQINITIKNIVNPENPNICSASSLPLNIYKIKFIDEIANEFIYSTSPFEDKINCI